MNGTGSVNLGDTMRIVAATDFSVGSDRALRRAALLSSKLGAPLTLVHVVEGDGPLTTLPTDRAAASDLLEEQSRTLRESYRLDVDWIVQVDDVYAGILAAAEEKAADLIIIGPHRRSLSDLIVGSTAQKLILRTPLPLLVAVDLPSSNYSSALLTLDFDHVSEFAARKAVVMGLFDHTEAVVMHAFDAPAEQLMRRAMEASAKIADYVNAEGVSASDKLRKVLREISIPPMDPMVAPIKGSVARTILDTAREISSDLIVLGTNQRRGLARTLIGSVAVDVVRDADRDLLIIPVEGA